MIHRFHTEFAKKYGLHEALLLEYFIHWIEQNELQGRPENFHDGRWWAFNSVSKIADRFEYLTYAQTRKALGNLEKSGALVSSNYNQRGFDRTKWYALGDEVINDLLNLTDGFAENHNSICVTAQIHSPNRENGFAQNDRPIPINKPIIEPIKGPIISNAREGEGINPQNQTEVIETFERSFGFINGQIAERLLTLLVDTGIEPMRKAMARAKTNRVSPRNAISYIETTAQGLADGNDFARKKNDVATAAVELERRLEEGGNPDGNDSADSSDPIWGVWGGK